MDGYYYSKYTFKNLEKLDKWTADSLHIMNDNMFGQHQVMRDQLQVTHTNMTKSLGDYMACSTNHLGIQTLEATCCSVDENGKRDCACVVDPPLSVDCCEILGLPVEEFCPQGRRSLMEGETKTHLTSLTVDYLNGGESMYDEVLEIERDLVKVMASEKRIEEKENEIQMTLDSMMSAMAAIQIKLDMDPTIDVDPKVDNNKSKKPKAKKPKAGKDDDPNEDLFNRKLLTASDDEMKRTIEAMEGKLDSVENKMTGKVESMESKVDKIEDKVESMESKVDKIEKSMKNIEDMLSKLLTTGGVAAG